jgi:8-oxo-dGTP pyrophosphatase MutT (NUDIX family)
MPDAHDDTWGHWERSQTEPGHDLTIFTSRFDTFLHPVTKHPLRATVLVTQPWVEIVAFTRDQRIVMVRQFRFGIGDVTLETPAGLVDEGEAHHDAAVRELREETGYAAADWQYLGHANQNPASHTENVHIWLATGAELTHAPEPEEGEHIAVTTLSQDEAVAAVQRGDILNPYTIVALSRVLDLRVV